MPSLVTNLGFASSRFNPSEPVSRLWWTAGTVAGLGVIALAYLVCFRHKGAEEMEFCLLCAAMLAGTVTVQGHYFVWLIFPMASAALRVAARPSWSRVLFLLLVALLLNQVNPYLFLSNHRYIYVKILFSYVPLYGLVALGVFLGRELLKEEHWNARGG